ncbi:MAG: HNH endonuclease [Bacteroidales bacterium]|nr:HNH endonuclease [Bacteroidales bacterium]
MKKGQRLWTQDELLLAINLYCKLPFGKIHRLNPEIIHLARLIDRTPNSISYKLVNFASFDPSLQARGIKGAVNASKLDKKIWNEFFNNWESLSFESEKLRAQYEKTTIEKLNELNEVDLPKEGNTREQVIQARVNQLFFRNTVLAAYNYTCCITGINQPELLVAGHIRPWKDDKKNRLNPRNGIAINGLHDKAFENGLMTITTDCKIKISHLLMKKRDQKIIHEYFKVFDGKPIHLPSRFLPDIEFLKDHNEKLRS